MQIELQSEKWRKCIPQISEVPDTLLMTSMSLNFRHYLKNERKYFRLWHCGFTSRRSNCHNRLQFLKLCRHSLAEWLTWLVFTCLPGHPARLHFPGSLAVRCGHMTEFWPMACEQKGWPPSPGRAHKNFLSWMFPSLSPSVTLMVNTPKTRGGQRYETAAACVLECPLEESWPTRNFPCVTVCHSS